MAGLSARSAVEMYVTMDSARYCQGSEVNQIVDGKIRQSTLYAGRGQPLLHRLQSQGVSG